MAKVLLKEIAPYQKLYRDDITGIAWIEDYTAGLGHSCHANIYASGSIRIMKKLGYWRKEDRCVRSHGFIYNIDSLVITSDLDEIARQYCRCGGKHDRELL